MAKIAGSAVLACIAAAILGGAESERPLSFESNILPIFQAKCLACHSGASPQGGLDLATPDSAMRGGKSGPAIKKGSSEGSLLVEKVVSKAMPPADPKLQDKEIALIRSWIDKGMAGTAAAAVLVTDHDILPIFLMRCVICHGKRKQEGGLDLRTQASRLKGGKSGPALVPGKPEESLLLKRITSGDMPPAKLLIAACVRPPTSSEVELIRKWIAAGAPPAPKESIEAKSDSPVSGKDLTFWSFQPPNRPAVPVVRHQELVRNPVDAFLLAKLEAKDLTFSSSAEPLVLMRRAYLDLIGVPPSSAEIDEYLKNQGSDAYERMVDRLLDSPQYGERWAQFWLNAAGYSDSEGSIDEDRLRSNAWRYRDYVIRSLNADKPYDQFLTEQIAGDELVSYKRAEEITPEVIEKLVATGFLRMASDGTYDFGNGAVPERINVIAEEIEVLASSVLGLTVGCARCHNHKYDPIPQRDYYRLSAVLQTAYDPYDWLTPTDRNIDIPDKNELREIAEFNAPLEAELKRLEASLENKAKPLREHVLHERLAILPEALRTDLQAAVAMEPEKRTPVQRYLAEKFQDTLKVTDDDLALKFTDFKAESEKIKKTTAELKKKLRDKPQIRALYEMGGEPSPAYLLRRGDAQSIGELVEPGVLSALRTGIEPYKVLSPRTDASGRRLALARWLVQPNHPLTSRVMVNRIWMHHFGRGLVASPSNFGRTGVPPSHPELLDWLATEFVRRGWSMKAMHRLVLTSTAYRQSSRFDASLHSADPDDILLSRMPLRRMDAEQLYDSVLKVTGRLDPAQFGPPVPVEVKPGGEVVARGSGNEGWRRSIYVLQRRTTPMTMLEVFDFPALSPNCIQRPQSTVSTQALQMMNGSVAREQARYLAGRLIDQFEDNREKQIEEIYLRVFARRPTDEETMRALERLADLTKRWNTDLDSRKQDAPRAFTATWSALASLCHAMLSSAGFMYID